MATAKPSRSSRVQAQMPKQSISKVEKARQAFISNPASTDRSTWERQRQALQQAELAQKVQSAYEKQYQRTVIAAAKIQAQRDAAAAAGMQSSGQRRRAPGRAPGNPARTPKPAKPSTPRRGRR